MVLRMPRISYVDLRFIDEVDRLGALRRIDGADPYLEIGGITEVAAGLPDCPALLFDRIKGFSSGFRIFYKCDDQFAACLLSVRD
jgi:4-hydroxy-3-polyprenylbenzoate decarboxylase